MRRTTPLIMIGILLLGLVGSVPRVSAEWFLDLYGGAGFVQHTDVSIEKDTSGEGLSVSSLDAVLKDVKIDDFGTGGLRVGHWFDTSRFIGLDVGLGVDAFFFKLETSSQTVTSDANVDMTIGIIDEQVVIPAGNDQTTRLPAIEGDPTVVMSFEFMLRRPLFPTAAFPHGRLQPQLTVAPALMFTNDDFDLTLGVKVGGGLTWQFHKHVALFVEYRFTHFKLDVDDTSLLVEGVVIHDPDVELDLNTHHVVAGLSLRF